MSSQTPTRPLSYSYSFPEERIEVKPSTELIADVFQRAENQNMLMYIFGGTTDQSVKKFKTLLTDNNYKVNMESLDKNIYDAEKRKELLKKIQENATGKDGLIMLFVMASLTKTDMEEIWSAFRSIDCLALKDKPKIFIFQIAPKVARDAIRRISVAYTIEFDPPSEADMMIVYEKVTGGSTFIENLTNNIIDYGKREDIASLVTHAENTAATHNKENFNERHVLISTMTKKFYFLPSADPSSGIESEPRGHHYEITKSYKTIDANLENLKRFAEENPHSAAHTPNEQNKSFFTSFTRIVSFKKSPNSSPKANKNREMLKTTDTKWAYSKTNSNGAAKMKNEETANSKLSTNDVVDPGPSTSTQSSGTSTPKSAGNKKQTAASSSKIQKKSIGSSKESIKSNVTPTKKTPPVKEPWRY